jgi:hypothetical protein
MTETLVAPEYSRASWHATIKKFIWAKSKEFSIREEKDFMSFCISRYCGTGTVETVTF